MTNESNSNDSSIELPPKTVDPSQPLSDRLTDNVQDRIGPARYFKKDKDGNPIEDWPDVFNRVATDVAKAESGQTDQGYWSERFEQAMREQRFIPNTPTIASAGTELQMLSACFVSSPGDSMEDILDTAKEWGLVEKTGGGMGGAFYKLRPKGERVSTTGGKASGPIPFIKLFDSVGGSIKQGGCIDASARVMSDSGYVPIWEIHDGRPLQRAGGESVVLTEDGFDAVEESSDSGEQSVVTIETEDGYSIDVTPNHKVKVLTENGFDFIAAGEISSGDTVVLDQSGETPSVSFNLNAPSEPASYHHNTQTVPVDSFPSHMTDDLATVLGIIAGDGTVDTEEDRIIVSLGNEGNADQDAAVIFKEFFESVGFNVTQRDRSGSEKGNYTRYEVRSQQLLDWFEGNNLTPSDGTHPTIPEPVYRSPEHLIDFCNGCTVDAHVNSDAGTIVYSTVSEEFSAELQRALLASGTPSSRSFIPSGSEKFGDNGIWTVRVSPGESMRQFKDRVYLFLDGEFDSGGQRQNQITVPGFIDSILDEHFEKRKKTDESVDTSSLKSLRRYARGDRTASLQRIRSLLRDVQVDPDEYRELDTNVLYDSVDSVEESGTKHVCDIENVSGRPEFIADNFSVHNIRSGAQMAIMHAHHADVGRFAVSKREEGALSNFNISVAVTDEFIDAVENDEQYTFRTADSLGPGPADPQEVLPETKHFYSPEFEDAWNDEYDKPGVGIDGETVEENVWRDYDITGIDEYQDRIDLTVGETMELPARFIWQLIIDGAWENGEPGVVHIEEADRQHSFDTDDNPETYQYGTNPCAEQILMEEEACNLGHVNLSLMVDESSQTFDEWVSANSYETNCGNESRLASMYLDYALNDELFEETVETGVRFLDNVVTRSDFPVDSITECVESNRKIGLGVMGFAQMLIQMGVEYGSKESYAIAEELMRRLDAEGTAVSHDLAKERGSFGSWEKSKYADPTSYPEWFRNHVHENPEDWSDGYPIRNHNITTVAPTGTTSRLGDTTGGCEPIYNTVFFKNVSDDIQGDEMLVVFDDYLERTLEANGIDVDTVKSEAVGLMKDNEFDSVGDVGIVPEKIDDVFVTAEDLSIDEHLEMQAAFQTYCDSGISKTANARFDATREDISDALLGGLQNGIKGTTVYRQGSREEQVNTTKLDNKEFTSDEVDEIVDTVESLVSADDDAADRIASIIEEKNGGEN